MKLGKLSFVKIFVLLIILLSNYDAIGQNELIWRNSSLQYVDAMANNSKIKELANVEISNYIDITVTVNGRAYNISNSKDLFLEYSYDNANWIKFETILRNNTISKNYLISGLNGSRLYIRARILLGAGSSLYNINSVSIEGVRPNNVLWLKADAGVSPNVSNEISRWDDQSGKTNNAASYNSANLYTANSLNYNPGVSFDPQRFMFVADDSSLDLTRMSVFSVIKPTIAGQYDAIIAKHDINYNDGYGIQYFPDGSNLKCIINPISSNIYGNNSASVAISNEPHIVGGTYDKSQIKVFTEKNNGVFAYNQKMSQNNAPLTLGGDHTTAGSIDVFEGDFNEVMIYNYAVTDDEKNKIESYLAIKYGITLMHDYVLSDGTVAYSLDNIYKYDVAGLARDDQWGLNQKISSSVNKTSSDVSNLVISMDNSFSKLNKDYFSAQLTNRQSIVCGKNNGDITSWIKEGYYKHVGERWKVQKNMTNMWSYVQLNLSSYPAADAGYSYHLILDDDETTANGVIKTISLSKNGDLYNGAVDFPSGVSYISVGYEYYEPLEVKLTELAKPSTNGANDGSFTFKIFGGKSRYKVWVLGAYQGEYDENADITIDNQASGAKDIVITDARNVRVDVNYFVPQVPIVTTTNSGDISDCTSSGTVTHSISVTNPNDYCADFSQSNAHIWLTDKSDINTNSNFPKRTIMFWFKTSADIISQQFLYKEGGGTNGLGFYIKDGFLYANIWKSSLSAGEMKTNLIKPNSWHHVALTWNENGTTNERYKAYIDGNLINSLQGVRLIAHSADIWFGAVDQAVLQDNTKLSGSATNFFAGYMDDFKLWNNALTQDQVRSEMNISTKSTIASLIVQYDFNDTSGVFKDISGKNYNASAVSGIIPFKSVNSVLWGDGTTGFSRSVTASSTTEYTYSLNNEKGGSATGKIQLSINDANKFMTTEPLIKHPCKGETNGSIELQIPCPIHFDGNPTKQRIDCGSKFLNDRKAFTIEAWMRFDINNMNTGEKHSFFGQDGAIEFGIYSSRQFHIWTARGGGAYFPLSVYPNDMKWHHVAIVGNGTQYIMYIDGVEVTRQSHTGIGSGTYGVGNSNNVCIAGSVYDPISYNSNSFEGDILKAGFWSKALSAVELKSIFDNNTDYTGLESGLIAGYNFYETTGSVLNAAGENNPHIATMSSASGYGLPAWDSFTYLWSNGATTKKIENVGAGMYSVDVVLSNGCKLTKQYTIAEPASILEATLVAPENACHGQTIEISANATGGFGEYKYIFFEGSTARAESIVNKYQKSITHNPSSPKTSLKVKVTDKNGCVLVSPVKELTSFPKVLTKSIQRN